MIISFLTLAWRHLLRHRFYALLNVVGLAVGIMCLLIGILYFDYHLNWDVGHEHEDRIYRVVRHVTDASGARYKRRTHPVAPHLKAAIPEIEEAARFAARSMWVSHGERGFRRVVAVVDSSFTRIFTIPMVKGNPERGLLDHGTCFISGSLAHRLFGDQDPIGKTISVSYMWIEGDYQIAGVMQDTPERAYNWFHYDILTATGKWKAGMQEKVWEQWPRDSQSTYQETYLLMRKDANRSEVQKKLDAFSIHHKLPEALETVRYQLQPFKEMHLYSKRDFGINEGEDITRCQIILGIGALVLLLACFNYINLITAQSLVRAKEVGLRKICGAYRTNLIGQFLGESILLTAMAFTLALGLSHLLLPFTTDVLGVSLALSKTSGITIALISLILIPSIGLLAGFYPAFVLSSHSPVRSAKGGLSNNGRKSFLRTGLVIFQFSVSAILIATTLVVNEQLQFIGTKDLGIERENIVIMPFFIRFADRNEGRRKAEVVRQEMASIPGVKNATALAYRPNEIWGFRDVSTIGSAKIIRLYLQETDREYFDTFDITFVAGGPSQFSGFQKLDDTAVRRDVVINERAARMLGLDQNAVGKNVYSDREREDGTTQRVWYHITGVIADYHTGSLRHAIRPIIVETPGPYQHMATRLIPGNLQDTMARLEAVWRKYLPNKPFAYDFWDQRLQRQYKSEVQLRKVSAVFAVLSILVSCLGILGLVTYTAQRRTKEVAIRKVLGATLGNILMLLSRDFIKLTVISLIIAGPIAYVLSRDWLAEFAYRIDLATEPFVLSALFTMVPVAITVGIQSWRSATTNPAESLRCE